MPSPQYQIVIISLPLQAEGLPFLQHEQCPGRLNTGPVVAGGWLSVARTRTEVRLSHHGELGRLLDPGVADQPPRVSSVGDHLDDVAAHLRLGQGG
jgi:hypothetical protein